MKKSISIVMLVFAFAVPVSAAGPFDGKIIALDAGHGGEDGGGATGYCGGVAVPEAAVNLAVRAELEEIMDAYGVVYHNVAQESSRQDRVADAEAAGATVLISIHHNGSTNIAADYTQSFVTQKNDKVFAGYIHPLIVDALSLPDRGIKSDGYGMTVYGSLPGVLTESYFITNEDAACDFIAYQHDAENTRVHLEADAMYRGLEAYFLNNTGGGKGRNR